MIFIIDAGGMGLTTIGEYIYARPGVAEKGYMDALLTVYTLGGHSSHPPLPHSGIRIVAEIIVALEANPFTPLLTKENPFSDLLECQAKYCGGGQLVTSPLWAQELSFEHLLGRATGTDTQADNQEASYGTCL